MHCLRYFCFIFIATNFFPSYLKFKNKVVLFLLITNKVVLFLLIINISCAFLLVTNKVVYHFHFVVQASWSLFYWSLKKSHFYWPEEWLSKRVLLDFHWSPKKVVKLAFWRVSTGVVFVFSKKLSPLDKRSCRLLGLKFVLCQNHRQL